MSRVGLGTIAGVWGRIGTVGFGGPPAHIALLRQECVVRRGWITPEEFSDGVAATALLPGPASTQLAIYCAWRLRGAAGALIGGLCFIAPGLVAILALSAVLLSRQPHRLVLAAAAGAGAAVAAVAVHAAVGLIPASWDRVAPLAKTEPPLSADPLRRDPGPGRPSADPARRGRGLAWVSAGRLRWLGYVVAAAVATALVGGWVVVVLVGSGLVEVATRSAGRPRPAPLLSLGGLGTVGPLGWTALKVGALSYGGGFVIIPLMQGDAVDRYHWLTPSQFLYAVALGQLTPGPVVHTVAVVGYAAAGPGGALLAATIAFAPSFVFVMAGARHFDALRANDSAQAFLTGAGAAAIGAIGGSAILLGLGITELWQVGVLAVAALWLLVLRRGVIGALLLAGALGLVAGLAGLPVS